MFANIHCYKMIISSEGLIPITKYACDCGYVCMYYSEAIFIHILVLIVGSHPS